MRGECARQCGAQGAALYMRLSKEDEEAGESASILTQRQILCDYAARHGIDVYQEYVDDGYSGTNFERPAFQRMLRAIDAGAVNLILVKDLSRFGREHLGTGRYLEIEFPQKGVRVVGVSDAYDSEKKECAYMAPFMNLVNEAYAKDISGKIRAAFQSKMESGKFIGSFAPYGYAKDPEDKNHLVEDPESAAVVRDIFAWAAQGEGPRRIAARLNARGVLPPAAYRCAQRVENYTKHGGWTAATIAKMIGNVVYQGHLAQGKTQKISFKIKKTKRLESASWILAESTHAPLVEPAAFALVQALRGRRRCDKRGAFRNVFSGLAKCADCGKNMSAVGSRRKDSPANLACGGYKLYGAKACQNHFIEYNTLYEIVRNALREKLRLPDAERSRLLAALEEKLAARAVASAGCDEILRLQKRLREIDRVIDRLYGDYAQGAITEARLTRMVREKEAAHRSATEKLRQCVQVANEDGARQTARERCVRALQGYVELAELTPALLHQLIGRIEIGQGRYERMDGKKVKRQSVRIYFCFAGKDAVYTEVF